MKIRKVAILGVTLSLITLFLWVTSITSEDHNTISLILLLFSIPAIILATLNTLYIYSINKFEKSGIKISLSFLPLITLIILSFQNNLSIPYMDSDLSLLAKISAVAIGVTNLIWVITLTTNSSLDN